jgi:hypothetical protein
MTINYSKHAVKYSPVVWQTEAVAGMSAVLDDNWLSLPLATASREN